MSAPSSPPPSPNLDLVIDCADPQALAEFWAPALGYRKVGFREPYFLLLPPFALLARRMARREQPGWTAVPPQRDDAMRRQY